MYRKILVPTDGSAVSEKAVTAAIDFARSFPGCSIVAFSAAESLSFSQLESLTRSEESDFMSKQSDSAVARVRRIAELAAKAGISCEPVVAESKRPSEAIVSAAVENKCDCIFMASNSRTGLNRLLLGSETQKVLTMSPVPVLVYR